MRALWLVLLIVACDQGVKPEPAPKQPPKPEPAPPPPPPPVPGPPVPGPPIAEELARYTKDLGNGNKLIATIETSHGALTCELYADKTPLAVANFVGLARGLKPWRDPNGTVRTATPFYDGLTFHRVIAGFMIQGGDPEGRGTGGPGYTFDNEIWDGGHFGPGALGMANAGTRNGHGTNGSQFFIMDANERPDLDPKHTMFGMCGSLDTIKTIARVQTNSMDKPLEPVQILRVGFAKR